MKKQRTVLLIEDDPDQIFMYQSKFELEGFNFISTRKGNEGIAAAETRKPDIILLDLILIAESGFDVLRKLKQNNETKKIPVVILTNLVKKGLMEEARTLGAADFVVKTNVMPSGVVQKVRDILRT